MDFFAFRTQILKMRKWACVLFHHHPYGLLGCLVMSLIYAGVGLGDSTPDQLRELHRAHQNQIQTVQQWLVYHREEQDNSPVFLLFERYQKFPVWNRVKAKVAVEQMVMAHGLRLRLLEMSETRSLSPSGSILLLKVNVGCIQEKPLFHFLEFMVTNLQPWIQIRHILIQRCGNVDENMLKELKNKNQIDIIEARFELDCLLSLD